VTDPLLSEIQAALGSDAMRFGAAIPERNRADMSGASPVLPLALVLPRTVEDVSKILELCNAHRRPVVPQGGMTGLVTGAHPKADEIAISLERMTGVEEIDHASGTLTALAGTPLQVIQEAAHDAGLMVGIDLGARGSCTIGGNVATNAGGNQVLRYGMTRPNVLGLEAVLADGRILRSLNKMMKNNTGYDWTQLMIGSEGTLGIVTRVVLSLHPRPATIDAALVAVPDTAAAIALLRHLELRLPGDLLVFEAMWSEFYTIATKTMGHTAPLPVGNDLILLIEASSAAGALVEALSAAQDAGHLTDAVIARSEADRMTFWKLRESVYEYSHHFPPTIGFDVSIPLNRMPEAIEGLRRRFTEDLPGQPWVVFGHLADSNIHVNMMPESSLPDARKRIEKVVYGVVKDLKGSISAEHGIGCLKAPYLGLSRTPDEIELMVAIKRTFDPNGILSPGRVFAKDNNE
jgi:FAD/FMN-containing dehydrogenase